MLRIYCVSSMKVHLKCAGVDDSKAPSPPPRKTSPQPPPCHFPSLAFASFATEVQQLGLSTERCICRGSLSDVTARLASADTLTYLKSLFPAEQSSTFISIHRFSTAYSSFGTVGRGCWRKHRAFDCAYPLKCGWDRLGVESGGCSRGGLSVDMVRRDVGDVRW